MSRYPGTLIGIINNSYKRLTSLTNEFNPFNIGVQVAKIGDSRGKMLIWVDPSTEKKFKDNNIKNQEIKGKPGKHIEDKETTLKILTKINKLA